MVFTFVPSLLALIHEVTSFEGDGTFKRCPTLHEWEMVIFYSQLQRGTSYHNAYILLQTHDPFLCSDYNWSHLY